MEFEIETAEYLNISDDELSELLKQVYIEGGYTEPEEAVSIFEPSAVRKRGKLYAAREKGNSILTGIIIIVPPDSAACKMAQYNESEIHLLAVKSDFRRFGLGSLLVNVAIDSAKKDGYEKIILWTQETMKAAQSLYETMGFIRTKNFSKNNRIFCVYEKVICA